MDLNIFVELIFPYLGQLGDFGRALADVCTSHQKLHDYFVQLRHYIVSDIHEKDTLCFLSSGYATAEFMIAYFIKNVLNHPIHSIILSDSNYTNYQNILET
jgi:hypothetical protein